MGFILVGGWYTYPSEKDESSSIGMIFSFPTEYKTMKNQDDGPVTTNQNHSTIIYNLYSRISPYMFWLALAICCSTCGRNLRFRVPGTPKLLSGSDHQTQLAFWMEVMTVMFSKRFPQTLYRWSVDQLILRWFTVIFTNSSPLTVTLIFSNVGIAIIHHPPNHHKWVV